jgi:uncharacterized protein (DUF1015 family)
VVNPGWAGEVPSPPHDALSAEQRRRHLRDHPSSYLGVTLSPEDIAPVAAAADAADVAARMSRASLERLVTQGAFGPERPPGFYLYRLRKDDHEQTGLVCGVATEDYDSGVVRIHEQINQPRADRLAQHLRLVGAQSNPIAMAYRTAPSLAGIVERCTTRNPPLLEISSHGLSQTIWAIDDGPEAVASALAAEPLYLIDGHHRAAAASADRQRQPGAGHLMLSVLFPFGQLRNEAFHRVLDGVDVDGLLARLAERFPVRPIDSVAEIAARPDGWIAVAAGGSELRWWLVELPPPEPVDGHVIDIEPVRLATHVLAPLLGIVEPTTDPRLSYRPGPAEAGAAAAPRVGSGQVEFWMRPVPLSMVLDLADLGLVMPPKSTYFEPKVRSGLFIRVTDPSLGPRS